jgi:hypothetical protein
LELTTNSKEKLLLLIVLFVRQVFVLIELKQYQIKLYGVVSLVIIVLQDQESLNALKVITVQKIKNIQLVALSVSTLTIRLKLFAKSVLQVSTVVMIF